MKPTLYLDIDGVLLANEENLVVGAAESLQLLYDLCAQMNRLIYRLVCYSKLRCFLLSTNYLEKS